MIDCHANWSATMCAPAHRREQITSRASEMPGTSVLTVGEVLRYREWARSSCMECLA